MSVETLTPVKTVLHVGCGINNPNNLHKAFRTSDWQEVRLDIAPEVQPDILADIKHMPVVQDNSVDAIWSSHNIEHLYWHEVPLALREFYRVLKPGGLVYLATPNLQVVAQYIAEGNLEEAIYQSPSGPIAAIDIFYGHRASVCVGSEYMAHKTGFTPKTLTLRLQEAGFERVQTENVRTNLYGLGYKPKKLSGKA